jgi:vanillate O-demethylase ferredoxin subunit
LCSLLEASRRYELAVLLEPDGRGGSKCVHTNVVVGTVLEIAGPRNTFSLIRSEHSILFAGGIGITPLLAMTEQLDAMNASFELHYCCRTVGRAAFLSRLGETRFRDKVFLHFDDGLSTQKLDVDAVLAGTATDSHLYVCGPPGFMKYVIDAARRLRLSDERIHREDFTANRGDVARNRAFEVCLAGSGLRVRVEPWQTVVEALQLRGVEVPVSCEQGICGTCVMRVLQGTPDHRDQCLSESDHAANRRFTPCCSRAKSDSLLIDF